MSKPTNTFLNRGLKLTHLQLIAALARTGGVQLAADQLSIAQPAASRLAMEIERIIGQKIHRRAGKGIELTQAGHALAKRAARILRELEDAQSDISEIGLGHVGNVRIGSVTGPSIKYILPVLRKARLAMPNVSISVEVSTSDILGARLINGDVDFVLGRLPEGHSPALFDQQPIALEPVSLIARNDHALAHQPHVTTKQLLEYDWVLPFKDTILFNAIERALRMRGLPPPKHSFSTSSFLLTLALVRQSNAIAPIATSVTDVFADAQEHGALQVIKSDFEVNVEVFSLLKLAGRVFTPSTQAVFELVKNITKPSA